MKNKNKTTTNQPTNKPKPKITTTTNQTTKQPLFIIHLENYYFSFMQGHLNSQLTNRFSFQTHMGDLTNKLYLSK